MVQIGLDHGELIKVRQQRTDSKFHYEDPQQKFLELDHFANAQAVQELQALISTDAHGDAVINLGHDDSVTLAGVAETQLRHVIQAGHVLLH